MIKKIPDDASAGAEKSRSRTRSAEYDAFGQWVDEVHSPADVPKLYRDFPLDFEQSVLVLKIPREIDRRDANPNMDLYDNLIILDTAELTILSRSSQRGYEVQQSPLRDIVGIRQSVNLLDGRLTIHFSKDRVVTVRFNGASAKVIDRFIDFVRRLAWEDSAQAAQTLPESDPAPGTTSRRLPLESDALGPQEEGLVNECRQAMRTNPELVVLAAHARQVLKSKRTGITGLIDLIWRRSIQAVIVCSDGRQLTVFTRAATIRRNSIPEYSTARLVLPLDRLDRVTVNPHDRYNDVSHIELVSSDTAMPIDVIFATDVESVLQNLG